MTIRTTRTNKLRTETTRILPDRYRLVYTLSVPGEIIYFAISLVNYSGHLSPDSTNRIRLTDQNPVQRTNFAPVPLYTLLDGDKPDSWARVFHTRFEIDSFVTLNLYLGSKHIVFLVQDMYILNFPFVFRH